MTENKLQILPETEKKMEFLEEYLGKLGSIAVAFSSGVDSTFLLKTAHRVLGDKVIAVTAQSDSFPKRELEEARVFCQKEGIHQIIFESKELELEGFCQNPPNRCYLCKRAFLEKVKEIAGENHRNYVVEGSNVDDEGDYRPGMQAVAELKIKSPLREARLTKGEIRLLSRKLGLDTWEKPSFACLSSRFPYGETITKEKLAMVEQGEQLLLELGFSQFRVRIHARMARIEVLPEDFSRLIQAEIRNQIIEKFREYGFTYVAMDLVGYRTGSMNEVL
ncbi:hypothetical protein C806_01733 [Lachnospiraceae bacterium 3-1]|nr:hypothetical protein C806_01733 [Lachnospiraceae bacterium 3-1]